MTRREKTVLGLIVGLGLALRLYRIGHQSLWVDEILTLAVSDPKPGLGIWDYLKYNIHGPAHSFVVYLFHLVSTSEAWLRLPSALAGTIAIFYFFKWASLMLGRRTALVASALLSINPMLVYYAQEVRNYSFLLMFGMMANYFFHVHLERKGSKVLVPYCLSMALAALSNFTAAFLFIVHSAIYLARCRLDGRALLKWFLVGLAILVLISPWVYRIYVVIDFSKLATPVVPGQLEETERLRGETTVSPAAVPYAFYALSVGFSLGPSLRFLHYQPSLGAVLRRYGAWVGAVALFFGLAGVLGAVRALRRRVFPVELSLYLWLPVVFTLLLCWQNAKAFNARYVMLSLPPFLCFVALGIGWPGSRWAKLLLLLGILVPSAVSLGNYYYRGEYAREDVRGAVRLLESRMGKGECVFAPTVKEVVEHYLEGNGEVRALFSPPGTSRSRVRAKLSVILSGCDVVWYVRARPWADDSRGYILEYLDERYSQTESHELSGVQLIRYERRANVE